MKRIVTLICIVAVLLAANTCFADHAIKKLGRGVANVLTCPIEIFYGIGQAHGESGLLGATTWGILNGFYRMGRRGVVGVYEVVTFPFSIPSGYRAIIDDPEFFFGGSSE